MEFNIICFQHCTKYVYCKKVPEICPVCNKSLSEEKFNFIPFRYPNPFKNAVQHPCAIVLKPTNGNFTNNYNTTDNLHIGVTKSDGTVAEFEENGLIISKTDKWNQCLVIFNAEDPWFDLWDTVLSEMCNEQMWTSEHYDEIKNNCFTFVLSFLCRLKYAKISDCAKDKHLFCKEIIVPQTIVAGRYIIIHRHLINNDFLIGY